MPVTSPQRHCSGVVEHTWKPLMVTGMCLATAHWVWRCAITAAVVDEHLSKGLYWARPHQRKRRSTPGSPTVAERITPGLAHRATAIALGSASAGLGRIVYCGRGAGRCHSCMDASTSAHRQERGDFPGECPASPSYSPLHLAQPEILLGTKKRQRGYSCPALTLGIDHSARRGHWP